MTRSMSKSVRMLLFAGGIIGLVVLVFVFAKPTSTRERPRDNVKHVIITIDDSTMPPWNQLARRVCADRLLGGLQSNLEMTSNYWPGKVDPRLTKVEELLETVREELYGNARNFGRPRINGTGKHGEPETNLAAHIRGCDIVLADVAAIKGDRLADLLSRCGARHVLPYVQALQAQNKEGAAYVVQAIAGVKPTGNASAHRTIMAGLYEATKYRTSILSLRISIRKFRKGGAEDDEKTATALLQKSKAETDPAEALRLISLSLAHHESDEGLKALNEAINTYWLSQMPKALFEEGYEAYLTLRENPKVLLRATVLLASVGSTPRGLALVGKVCRGNQTALALEGDELIKEHVIASWTLIEAAEQAHREAEAKPDDGALQTKADVAAKAAKYAHYDLPPFERDHPPEYRKRLHDLLKKRGLKPGAE
jgi:hypothetical protein